jgi:hypothetical protein
MSAWEICAVVTAGLGTGAINAVVGSGTLISFPTSNGRREDLQTRTGFAGLLLADVRMADSRAESRIER